MNKTLYNAGGILASAAFGGFVGLLLIGFLTSHNAYEEKEFVSECWRLFASLFALGFIGAMISTSYAGAKK